MKKSNIKEILFLVILVIVIFGIEIFLPRTNDKLTNEEEVLDVVDVEGATEGEVSVGDCTLSCAEVGGTYYNKQCWSNPTSGLGVTDCQATGHAFINGMCYMSSVPATSVCTGVCCCTSDQGSCGWFAGKGSCESPYPNQISGATSSNCTSNIVIPQPPKPTPKPCVIDGMSGFNIMSNGSTRVVTVQTTNCSGTPSASGSNGISAGGVSNRGSGYYSFTISANGKCDDIGSYTFSIDGKSKTQKVLISNDWRIRENVTINHKPASYTQSNADLTSNWEYGYCVPGSNGTYNCSVYGWRSCGEPGVAPSHSVPEQTETTPNTEVTYNCYANDKDLKKATVAKWQSGSSADAPHKIEKVSEAACIATPKVTFCNPQDDAITPQSGTASGCEKDVTVKYKDGRSCSGTSFYKIVCDNSNGSENKIIVSYDNGNDKSGTGAIKTSDYLLPGQGFEFAIDVELHKKCTATFDAEAWKKAYKSVDDTLKTINAKKYAAQTEADKKYLNSLASEWGNIKKSLLDIANEYNDIYNYIDAYNKADSTSSDYEKTLQKVLKMDLSADVSLKYPTDDGDKTLTAVYAGTITKGKIVRTNDKTLPLLDNLKVKNYHWDNYTSSGAKPYKVKFVFPEVYLNAVTGEISSTNKGINGGNKLYIDYNAKGSKEGVKSNMTITVSGKKNKNDKDAALTATNEKCNIKVFTVELKYRPIEITNPFINSSYKKGENWVNSRFDFTKTIKADTWENAGTLYNRLLRAEEIAALKDSNEKNSSSMPYLGLCQRLNSYDAITKSICDELSKIK